MAGPLPAAPGAKPERGPCALGPKGSKRLGPALGPPLAMYFTYAVDIWYVVGSFVVPALLIPLIAGLYRIKLKNVVFVMILPVIVSAFWYFHGVLHPLADGYPSYIWDLDPMYPGIMTSLVLCVINR